MAFLLPSSSLYAHTFFIWLIICFFAAGSQAISLSSSDLSALLSFKALLLDSGSISSSWDEKNESFFQYCKWQGITCDSHRRVMALQLDSVNLAGPISPSLANLTFLRFLSLSNNHLYGSIPLDFHLLPQLQYLDLSSNSLTGSIPASLAFCSNLRYLNLSYNFLVDEIPHNLSRCLQLRRISLGRNQLVGGIPPSFGSLTNLVVLDLNENNLTGKLPSSLGNLSSLSILDLAENSLQVTIPTTFGMLYSLTYLKLMYNNLSGEIPSSIFNLSSIEYFNVAENRLSGKLPHALGNTLTRLQILKVDANRLQGTIPPSLSNASSLERIALFENQFIGTIPSNLGSLSNLSVLALYDNQVEAEDSNGWVFLASLTNCSKLQILSLTLNNFRGIMPISITNLSLELTMLGIGGNYITGEIPVQIGRLVNLQYLNMENNLLTGIVPDTLGKLHNLKTLYLGQNRLTGRLSSFIHNMTQLNVLHLSNNKFGGSLPSSLQNIVALQALDLSYNELTGTIPKELVSLSSLSQYLNLSNNLLSGTLPREVGSLINLAAFDVSSNEIAGEIPGTFSSCVELLYLDLHGNLLQGAVPQTLSSLKGLRMLDLSSNNLSGLIPVFLETFTSLEILNISQNNFNGQVPDQGIFASMTSASILGNKKLCGGISILHLPSCSARNNQRALAFIIVISVAGIILLLVLISCLVYNYRKNRSNRGRSSSWRALSFWNLYMRISYTELNRATNGFSSTNLIGVGTSGSVYKGVIGHDLEVVAIKVFDLQKRGSLKSFVAECEALRHIRHRNIIKILAPCSSIDHKGDEFKALVYEFMPNGSLEDWLHPKVFGSSRSLTLIEKFNIAIDVAFALDHLHHQSQTPIVHGDIKPSNILICDDMSACISDFGLAKFLHQSTKMLSKYSSSCIVGGSIGYIAPEYGIGSLVSTEGDVYSYGVLLLEMFTGKRPTDESFSNGLNLHRLVEMAYPDRLMDVLDPSLLLNINEGDIVEKSEMNLQMVLNFLASVIKTGLQCSKESPKERVSIGVVVKEMLALKSMVIFDAIGG